MSVTAFEEIMNLRGYEEFKALAERLRTLGENRRHLTDASIRVPNFLFAEAPGAGVTTQIKLLTRLIAEQKLLCFMGERHSFEWALDHEAFEEGGSFDRLLMEVDAAAGFYSYFSGVVGIELDGWADRPEDRRLDRLKAFVADTYGQIVFVFVTEKMDSQSLERLECALNAPAPIDVVRCPLPSPADMAEYLIDFLGRRGFSVNDEARAAIAGFMPELMETVGFDGMQTMNVLADEIIFDACSADSGLTADAGAGKPVLSKRHLRCVTGKQGYIALHRRSPERRKIGFEGRSETNAEL